MMISALQIISAVLVIFVMVFTPNGRNYSPTVEDRSETSSEKSRECSPDEMTCRISAVAQSGVTHLLRNGIRFHRQQLPELATICASFLKKSAVSEASPNITRINISTTVLRI